MIVPGCDDLVLRAAFHDQDDTLGGIVRDRTPASPYRCPEWETGRDFCSRDRSRAAYGCRIMVVAISRRKCCGDGICARQARRCQWMAVRVSLGRRPGIVHLE